MPPIPIRLWQKWQQNKADCCNKEGVAVLVVNHGVYVDALSDCACADIVNDANVCAVKDD